jgi:anti-sigma B factor antagonist
MLLRSEVRGNVLVAHVESSRIDAAGAQSFKQEFSEQIDRGFHRIVLDLKDVEFVDSSGLGAMISCLKHLGPRGSLALTGIQGAVKKLFSLTRMDKVFPIYSDVDDAIRNLS